MNFEPLTARWRIGRSVGRTLYAMLGDEASDDDVLIGLVDSQALAERIVADHNSKLPTRQLPLRMRDEPRSCNRHRDCDAADALARAEGRISASHCDDECCEDCFGC